MKLIPFAFAALFTFAFSAAALAETKVTVSNMHICCPMCKTAIDKTLGDIDGVKFEVDQKGKSVAISAEGADAAQKALDALVAAGFSGKLDNEDLSMKAAKAPEGKVKRLELTGVHNCCGACTKAITGVLGEIDGVSANTACPPKPLPDY